MSTNSTTTIIKSDEGDSLNNGLLFRPVTDRKCDYVLHDHQTMKKEPFFLSPPKLLSNGDESTMMQTSTLIISTPPQYHYYLYPPIDNTHILSSSSSSSSSSSISSKKNSKLISTTNRTISNVSINSVSTSSSSSYRSYESQTHDNEYPQSSHTALNAEDETASNSTYSMTNHNNNNNNKTRQKKVIQSALIDWKMKSSSSEINNDSTTTTKPVILSDSVQAFWPPPPSPLTLDKDSGLITTSLTTTEQTKQSESIPIPNNIISSSSHNDSINVNHIDILSTKEEIGSYSEQHTFTNGCLRNASDTSLEDTQASYTERLREKSRSIPMNANNDMYSYLTRSISKDALNDYNLRPNTNLNITEFSLANENILKPKSAGQQIRTTHIISKQQSENSDNDFRSKREFFENRTYTDNTSINSSLSLIPTNILPTKPKIYTLSPANPQNNNNNNNINNVLQQTTINNNPQRNVTRRSWNDLSSRQLPPPPSSPSCNLYFDSTSNQTSFPPPPTIRKPVRIVKAVQRSSPPINESMTTNRPLTTSKTYSLAKPGLFSASPLNSYQKIPNKTSNSIRRFQSRDENDLQFNLKEFALRYPHIHSLNESERLTLSNEHRLSTDYTRALFPIPDRLRRIRSRQSSGGDTSSITNSSNSSSDYIHRTVSNDSCIFDDDTLRQAEDLLINLKKRQQILKENQRTINEEIEDNKILGAKLLNIIESNAESSEIEKFKLHINEIDTITSILLKLSSRLAKVENDLLTASSSSEHIKASLIERREKAQQKHDEAKSLKDGIDRRSRLVTNMLRKYFSNEQYDDYEHFIRMKSTLLMDAKDIEENILIIEKQIEILTQISISDCQDSQTLNKTESLQTNSFKAISSTA
ncbi:unnamed protein product [Rotaria sp. Silwood2]|nr:unnamed protein product [Rotaria sp. Silwood2]